MLKKIQPNKYINEISTHLLISGFILFGISLSAHATHGNTITAEFNSDFLVGNAHKIDTKRFAYGNAVLPGVYNVDVYINDNWFGKHAITFKKNTNDTTDDSTAAHTCFTAKQLLEYGVKTAFIQQKTDTAHDCRPLETWIESAFYEFDTAKLRFDVSIPQVAMQHNAQGYIDPSVWDRGIDAAFASYHASAYKTQDRSADQQESTSAFLSMSTGANIAGWQLRHNGQWQWRDNADEASSRSKYDAVSTYAQRAFPEYHGVLTLGDGFSNGDIFDSFGYRGVDFSSDERMLPSSMTGYAPRIRGNAKTNAKVEIRQHGQLIYQTTVAPGNFEINDLYPTGFGGELDVVVLEADGQIQRYSIPYASVAQMLRPGMSKYSLTAGAFRDQDIDLDPLVVQAQYHRGINNHVTTYGGVQLSEDYAAVTLGSAFATPIGAIAVDVSHSQTEFEQRAAASGQSIRASYSKLITPTNTNITLAAYRYSTKNFYKLRDAVMAQEHDHQGIKAPHIGKQRSEFQVTLNQGLPRNMGNVYATSSWIDYWDRPEANKQYQLGYSNSYRGVSYGISALKRVVENAATDRHDDDTEYMLTLSLPLTLNEHTASINAISTTDSTALSLSGVVGNRASYGASISNQYGDNPSVSANAQYRSNVTTIGGAYSLSDHYQRTTISARGNVIAHADGILFGPDQGQTMVVVYAPHATGAKVNNTAGLTINKAGYAVIPYITPYRINHITLDPKGMSLDVELQSASQRITPYAGSIAKVDFATKSGKALYIHSLSPEGHTLPFAAEVIDSTGDYIGMVAQGSLVYLRTDQLADTVTIKWGESPSEQCQIEYDATAQKIAQDIIMLEGICQ